MGEPWSVWQGFMRWFQPDFPGRIPGGEDLSLQQKAALVYRILDNKQSLRKRLTVWWVASSGFYTDSYNLFATNVILPMLSYVYWGDANTSYHETIINILTLLGSVVGQILFGFLADKFGRKRIYGLELVLVLFGTIGIVQCSAGYDNESMSILASICFWRFIIGVGIGAEYPISAAIAAEFSPVRSRAQIMAAVFLMQPLGQLSATFIGYAVIRGLCQQHGITTETRHDIVAPVLDIAWRVVIGVGAFPALLAVIARLSIPESPRFILDVVGDADEAVETLEKEGYESLDMEIFTISPPRDQGVENSPSNSEAANGDGEGLQLQPQAGQHVVPDATINFEREILPRRKSEAAGKNLPKSWHQFFHKEGNWRYIVGTSLAWFCLDFVFYGLGINNPRTIAKIWADHLPSPQNITSPPLLPWQDPYNPNNTIYEVLRDDAIHSMITVSIGSLVGSLLLVFLIDYIPRRQYLVISFCILTGLFAIIGSTFLTSTFGNGLHGVTISMYVLCQLFFNFGPNTLTFIIPAEIFPTRFRATCHGIAAASGKIGSIIVLSFLPYASFSGTVPYNSPLSNALGKILLVFCAVMALGAFVSWAWIPELQDPRVKDGDRKAKRWTFPSRTLEDLAGGRMGSGVYLPVA